MEELEEEIKDLNGIATPQEDQQCQVTWTHGRSQRLTTNQRAYIGWSKAPRTYVTED